MHIHTWCIWLKDVVSVLAMSTTTCAVPLASHSLHGVVHVIHVLSHQNRVIV